MDLNDIDLKTWRRYEKIRALYERHPALYRLRLVLLLLFGLTNIFVLLVFVFLHVLLFYMGLNDLGYGKITLGVGLMVFAAGISIMVSVKLFHCPTAEKMHRVARIGVISGITIERNTRV